MKLKQFCDKQNIKMKDLAAMFWPELGKGSQKANMSDLNSGKRKSIQPEWINILVVRFGITEKEAIELLTKTEN